MIAGLGVRSARHIEAFFAAHPVLTERARALVVVTAPGPVMPWENIRVPHEVDGSRDAFRTPRPMCCALRADNDVSVSTTPIQKEAPPPRPRPEEFFVGDTVGFTDKHLNERVGTVVKLNAKTASIAVTGSEGHWRVSYGLLRKIVDI